MLFAASAAFADSTTITITPASGISAAEADQSAWVLANFGSSYSPDVLENFSEDALGAYYSLSTAVGTFSVAPGSQPGEPGQTNGTGTNQFTILDAAASPFCCRYPLTPGGQWLDSNDITGIQLNTTLSNIFFIVTDVNNVLPTDALTITAGGTSNSGFAEPGAPDNIYFVGITSSGPIGTIQWLNNTGNDGFGLDDFGTAQQQSGVTDQTPTPEPSAGPIGAVGLVAILLFRKYKAQAARSNGVSA
jgi:hypothetical protein